MKGFKGKIKKKITIKLIGDAEKAFNDLNKVKLPRLTSEASFRLERS